MSGHINYVTVERGGSERYAAFFDLLRLKKVGPDAVHLMVLSAYVLDANKPAPGKGRISFHALLGHALRDTTPRQLEAHARDLGVRTLQLETNRTLKEAQALYRRSGYREVKAFNSEPYAHHWFEKRLPRTRARRPARNVS